jgi:hypothetical protein
VVAAAVHVVCTLKIYMTQARAALSNQNKTTKRRLVCTEPDHGEDYICTWCYDTAWLCTN